MIKISPIFVDGPWKGKEHEFEMSELSSVYVIDSPPIPSTPDPSPYGPSGRTLRYFPHRYGFFGRALVLCSVEQDFQRIPIENLRAALDELLSERGKKAIEGYVAGN